MEIATIIAALEAVQPRTAKKLTDWDLGLIRPHLPRQCKCCGTHEKLTVDHILARCLGGSNQLENLQTLCLYCNQQKAKTETKILAMHQYYQKLKYTGELEPREAKTFNKLLESVLKENRDN